MKTDLTLRIGYLSHPALEAGGRILVDTSEKGLVVEWTYVQGEHGLTDLFNSVFLRNRRVERLDQAYSRALELARNLPKNPSPPVSIESGLLS